MSNGPCNQPTNTIALYRIAQRATSDLLINYQDIKPVQITDPSLPICPGLIKEIGVQV